MRDTMILSIANRTNPDTAANIFFYLYNTFGSSPLVHSLSLRGPELTHLGSLDIVARRANTYAHAPYYRRY